MMKVAVLGLLFACVSAVTVTGLRDIVIANAEEYPATTDGTRLDSVCVGSTSVSQFLYFNQAVPVMRVELVAIDGEGDAADFQIVHNSRSNAFSVTFVPSAAGQSSALVYLFDAEDNTMHYFGIAATSYAPELEFQSSNNPGVPVTSWNFGELTSSESVFINLDVVNMQPTCVAAPGTPAVVSNNMVNGQPSSGFGFSAQSSSGFEVSIQFVPDVDGLYTATVTVGDVAVDVVAQFGETPAACTDYRLDDGAGAPWHDGFVDGNLYGCDYYGNTTNLCKLDGHNWPFQGWTANQACCACRGGVPEGGTQPPSPTDPDTCFDMKLDNGKAWHDDGGEIYNCSWYNNNEGCEAYGDMFQKYNATANVACCSCDEGGNRGGADRVLPSGDSDCVDRTFDDGTVWNDGHPEFPYTCKDYDERDLCGTDDAKNFENGGLNAKTACCACQSSSS